MATVKRLGIWMDHSAGHMVELTADFAQTRTLKPKFTWQEQIEYVPHRSNRPHDEQNLQQEFYESLARVIKDYDEVILFGPSDAKLELVDMLRADHHFDKKMISVKQTDYMTQGQQHAFVRDHFSNAGVSGL